MRVLFATVPGYGSFQPLVPFAHALVAAGHDMAFAASSAFCRMVTRARFRCFPADPDVSLDDKDAIFATIASTLGPHSQAVGACSLRLERPGRR